VDVAGNKSAASTAVSASTLANPDTTAPTVTISTPAAGATLAQASVTVTGTATDTSGISQVTVNGTAATLKAGAGGSSSFSASITLVSGANTITVVAKDNSSNQNTTTQTRSVTYTPATPPPAANPSGTVFYVRADATGLNDGSNWNHAYTRLPATLLSGATYYLASGTYGGYTFAARSGDGSLITAKKATDDDHGPDPGATWVMGSTSYGLGVALFTGIGISIDNVTIDGVTGGGPGQWETGFGIRIFGGGYNIGISGPRQNITLRHLDIENQGRSTHLDGQNNIYATGGVKNLTVSYSYLHDVSICHLFTRNTDGVVLEYSKMARNGTNIGDTLHRESWSATTDNNITIRYNIYEDISNSAVIGIVNGTGNADNWKIYGNVFLISGRFGTFDASVSAIVDVRNDNANPDAVTKLINMTANNWEFHNNAVINFRTGSSAGFNIGAGINNKAYNNIWFNNAQQMITFNNMSHDYNLFIGNINKGNGLSIDADLARTEAHGLSGTVDPFVAWSNGNFNLKSATGAGLPIAPVTKTINGNQIIDTFDKDAFGITRGSTGGIWDRGPYQH